MNTIIPVLSLLVIIGVIFTVFVVVMAFVLHNRSN